MPRYVVVAAAATPANSAMPRRGSAQRHGTKCCAVQENGEEEKCESAFSRMRYVCRHAAAPAVRQPLRHVVYVRGAYVAALRWRYVSQRASRFFFFPRRTRPSFTRQDIRENDKRYRESLVLIHDTTFR